MMDSLVDSAASPMKSLIFDIDSLIAIDKARPGAEDSLSHDAVVCGSPDSSQSSQLTTQQRLRIAENRQKASEQRALIQAAALDEESMYGSPDSSQFSQLTTQQQLRIAESRQRALERRAQRQMLQVVQDPRSEDVELTQTQIPSTQDHDAQAMVDLSQAQLDRISRNREEALKRRHQRQALSTAMHPEVDPHLPPTAEGSVPHPGATPPASNAVMQSATGSQGSPRSRTPERRPRRQLMPMVTASPPPRPTHLAPRLVPEQQK